MKESQNSSIGNMLFKGSLIFNPVLVQIVGICPIVAASTSLFSSVLLSAVFALDMILTCVVASAAMREFPRFIRVALYLLFGLAITCPVMYMLEEFSDFTLSMSTKIYLPLMAINSVAAVHCEQFSVKNTVRDSFADALAVSIGYSAVYIITGTLREYLGNGTIAGYALPQPYKLPGMLMPFGSLIILGYLAMTLKWYISKFQPQYLEETIMKIQNTSFKIKREPEAVIPEPVMSAPPAVFTDDLPEEVGLSLTVQEAPNENPPVPTEQIEAFEEIEDLNRRHSEFVSDTDKSLEELIASLETDIDNISAPKKSIQDGEDKK